MPLAPGPPLPAAFPQAAGKGKIRARFARFLFAALCAATTKTPAGKGPPRTSPGKGERDERGETRPPAGAVQTRRLAASDGTDRPSGNAYGNPLRGTRDNAPAVPIGAPVIARTDVPDARGWRVYRVAPNGAVIYDGWIEHDPANAKLVVAELRAAATASPAAALRRAVERQPGHASGEAITRWLAGQEIERLGAPATPRSRAARRRWRRALARRGGRP